MSLFSRNKALEPYELGELKGINSLVKAERYKLSLVQNNAGKVKGAKPWMKTQTDLIALLEEKRDAIISQAALRLGLTGVVEVDVSTGEIWTRKQ